MCCSILCPDGGGSANMLHSALCSAEEEANGVVSKSATNTKELPDGMSQIKRYLDHLVYVMLARCEHVQLTG